MPKLGELKDLWVRGAAVLFLLVLALGVWGAGVALIFTVILEIIGEDSDQAIRLAFYTSWIWGPLPTGYVMRALPRMFVGT